MQEFGGNTGDIDDDEGGGLVSNIFLRKIALNYQISYIYVLFQIIYGTPLMRCNSHI